MGFLLCAAGVLLYQAARAGAARLQATPVRGPARRVGAPGRSAVRSRADRARSLKGAPADVATGLGAAGGGTAAAGGDGGGGPPLSADMTGETEDEDDADAEGDAAELSQHGDDVDESDGVHASWSTSDLWNRLTGQSDHDGDGGGGGGATEPGEERLLMRDNA